MGQTLEKPAVEKHYDSGNGKGLNFAACGMQGWRLDMEDSHTAKISLGDGFEDVSFFGVFDGHAGSYTSKIASEQLFKKVQSTFLLHGITKINENMSQDEKDTVQLALIEAFVNFDDELKESEPYKSLREGCGSTALAVLITQNFIIFCNCGDSRGFLSRNDGVHFETKDHKPSDPAEKSRIENSGGCVIMDRVNGNLAVSRALGDFSFKDKGECTTKEQAVSPEPTITIISRTQESDQFIILACDGIWDVMSCEDVRKFVSVKLMLTNDLQMICADLIDNCLMKDSRDNMTALIVTFPNAPTISSEEVELDLEYEEQLKQKIKDIMESQSNISLISVLNTLIEDKTLCCCKSYELGIYAKKRFIENFMNSLEPSRETERDYSNSAGLPTFPIALQAIQQLVKSDHSENPIFRSTNANNDALDQNIDLDSDKSPSNEE